jgi:hypothetical protein
MMGMISRPPFSMIKMAAQNGNPQARVQVSYCVGQGVSLVESVTSAGSVVQTFKTEFIDATERLNSCFD